MTKSFFWGTMASVVGWVVVVVLTFIAALFLNYSVEIKLAILTAGVVLLISMIAYIHFVPQKIIVLGRHDTQHKYLIDKNTYRHIPDQETFDYLGEYLGFNRNDIVTKEADAIKRMYSPGSKIPSILPYCERYHKKKVEEEKQSGK